MFQILCFFDFALLRILPSECLAIRSAEIGGGFGIADSSRPPVRVGRYRFRSESEDRVRNQTRGRNITQGARAFFALRMQGAAMGPASMCPDHRLRRLARRASPSGGPISPPTENAPLLSEFLGVFRKCR